MSRGEEGITDRTSKRRKRWLVAGGVLGVLVLLLLIIPYLISWNNYKQDIEILATKVADRPVAIDGPLDVTFLPLPALNIHEMRIGNLPGGTADEMARIQRLEVRVAVLPLLFGDLSISRLIFHKPTVALEVLPDGRENWRLGKPRKYLQKPADRIPNLKLERFLVKDGHITYRTAGDARPHELLNVALDTEAKSFDGPFKGRGRLTYQDVPIAVDFSMSRKGIGGKTPFKGHLKFAKAEFETSGIIDFGDEKLETELSYDGEARIESENFGETLTALQMIAGIEEIAGLTLVEPLSANFRLTASADKIETRGLKLKLGASAGTGQLLFEMGDIPRADIGLHFSTIASDVFLQALPPRDESSPPITLADIFQALDPGAIIGDVTLSADEIRQGSQIIRQAEIVLSASEGKLIIKKFHALLPGASDVDMAGILTGGETPEFTGRIVTASNNLRSLLDWMDVEIKGVPPGRMTAFALVSNLSVDQSRYHFSDALFRLDDMTARGDVTYSPGENPYIGVVAKADRLSLGNYLAPGSDCVGGGATDTLTEQTFNSALSSTDMFDVGRLKLQLDLTVDEFSCRPITGSAVEIKAALTGGQFALDTFKAQDLLGLRVDGKGLMDTVGQDLVFDFDFAAEGQTMAGLGKAFPRILPIRDGAPDGKVVLNGKIEGRLDDLRVHASGHAGQTELTANASLGFANKRKGETGGLLGIAAKVSARGPSFETFAQQWDLGLPPPSAADDKPFSLTASFRGTGRKADIDFNAAVAGGTIDLSGFMRELRDRRSYEMSLKIKGEDTRGFLRGIGFDVARDAHGLGPIALDAKVLSDAHSITLEQVRGNLGPAHVAGTIVVSREGERRKLSGDLNAGDVDLDRLLGASPDAKPTDWSAEPFRLERLSVLDTDLDVTAETLTFKGLQFDHPSLKLSMENGQLAVKDMTAGLFGGRVALNYVYGPQGPQAIPGMGLGFAIQDGALQQALEGTLKVGGLSGTLNIKGTLAGVGETPAQLVRGLQGQADFDIGPGIITDLDIPALLANLKTMKDYKLLNDMMNVALSTGETEHRGAKGRLTVRKGKISLPETTMPIDGGRIVLAATGDLPEWSLWANGKLEFIGADLAAGAATVPAATLSQIVPIGLIISGGLERPQLRYQTGDFHWQQSRRLGRPPVAAPQTAP